ncbi:hypothetical protein Acr_01g0006510 [Actinidia rufa]|uniref:Uncharacterized protein n=1 Tax=Actinidia rufa TaxID=165716 RepID=A0A7J0E3K1_9ERIC|nr:hypothetical protein Acr_01g0006510 [Actinidia rufa]
MTDEMNRLPSSPRENPPEASPLGNDLLDNGDDLGSVTHSSPDTLLSTMNQGDLDQLRKTYSFPAGVQARIPAENETILSTHPGEVAFYKAAFPAGLSKRCNKLPLLIDTEKAKMRKVLQKIGPEGYFNVPDVLDSRTFHHFFTSGRGEMFSSGGDKDMSRDGVVAASADKVMSERITLSKLAKRVDDKKNKERSKVATSSNIGVMIQEKRPQDEVQDLVVDDSKGKEVALPPKAKKAKPSKAASKGVKPPMTPKGESSKRPLFMRVGEVLGKGTSVYASPFVEEKLLSGVILPANREKVDKLSLDQVVTKFFHVLSQILI